MTADSDMNDFDETSYARLIDAAAARYSFRRFGDHLSGDNIAIWRHDIDFSPHRALALSRIESERGVTASYFVLFSSPFYNVFEPKVGRILNQIAALGHDIGIHYDASLLRADADVDAHEERLRFEAGALSVVIGAPVASLSLHNPSVSPRVQLDSALHAGLINASASSLRRSFEYCSDSNGVWRFRSLQDVVADASVRRLYALTHAEWWTPRKMTPGQRVERAVQGRASAVLADYEVFLRAHRPEVLDYPLLVR